MESRAAEELALGPPMKSLALGLNGSSGAPDAIPPLRSSVIDCSAASFASCRCSAVSRCSAPYLLYGESKGRSLPARLSAELVGAARSLVAAIGVG